jgi:sec-independent protein translocase protein TatA
MPNIGPLEIVIVLIIALIVFGPKRLPELGRSMGKGIREFKNSLTTDKDDDEDVRELEPSQAAAPERPLEGEVVHDRRP